MLFAKYLTGFQTEIRFAEHCYRQVAIGLKKFAVA